MAETELKVIVTQEGATEAKEELTALNETVKENGENAVVAALKNQELREIMQGVGQAFAGVGQAMAQAATITNEQQRSAAMASAAWDGVKASIMAVNPVIGSAVMAVDAAREAITAMVEAEERLQRDTAFAYDRFQDLNLVLTESTVAAEGFIDSINLMNIAVEAHRQGLELTDRQYAEIIRTAREYSEATGTEATEATRELIDAIRTGNQGVLSDYGFHIDEAATAQERLVQATEESRAIHASATNTIEQNRDALISLGHSQEEVDAAIQNGSRAREELTAYERQMLDLMVSYNERLNQQTQASNENALAIDRQAEAQLNYYNSLVDTLAATQALTAAEGGIYTPGLLSGQTTTEAVEEERRARQSQGRDGGGGSREEDEWDPSEALQRAIARQQQLNDLTEPYLEMQLDSARIESERSLAEVQRTNELRMQNDALNEQKDLITRNAEMQAQAQALQEQRTQEQDQLNRRVEAFNNFSTLGVDIAMKANKDGRKAARETLKEWLKNFAIQESFESGRELAFGIGKSMNPLTAAEASGHFIASAKHAALAAATGGGAGALAGGGGGGGRAGASTGGPMPSSGSSERETASPRNITINLVGQTYLTQDQVGRGIKDALIAYEVRN